MRGGFRVAPIPMKFKFIGNGQSDPEAVTLFGHRFPLGEPVEVKDAFLIGKLRHNNHFAEVRRVSRKSNDQE